jgi:hypothetical protein
MFKRATGLKFYDFLRQLHGSLLFDWYLEIGCRKGDSFAPVRSKTIAVDPFFRVEMDVIGKKPALFLFQSTSDDFFASGFLARNGIRLGLSFLDGMHLYEYLLRDVMHTEAASDPGGAILLHDCLPFGHGMMTRDLDNLPKGAWTGDVWKLIPILRKWRPDLKLTVLDCAPTGLVCLTNLSPGNRVLFDNYDAIRREFDAVDLAGYGLARFNAQWDFTDAQACADGGFSLFRPASIDPAAELTLRLHST